MNALVISSDLKEFINKKNEVFGQVHSVFNGAVNLITESDDLITILAEHKAVSPMSINVKCENFQESFIKKGNKFVLKGGKIVFPDNGESVNLKNADVVNVNANLDFEPASPSLFKKHITILENVIDREGNMDGIASVIYYLKYPDSPRKLNSKKGRKMNQYASFIHDRIQQFINDFQVGDTAKFHENLRRIIGFGPGLTPSTDDFIVGFSASLLYMTRLFPIKNEILKEMNKSIYECCLGRTTRISEELIKHVTGEKMSELLQEVFESLFSSNDSELQNKLSELIAYGDTSGTDLILGVYVTIRLFGSEEVRRIYS